MYDPPAPDRQIHALQRGMLQDWPRHALANARIVFYSVEHGTGQALRSENSDDALGLSPAAPDARWSELIFPEDLPLYRAAVLTPDPGHAVYEVEYRIRHPQTARQFWVLDRGEWLFDHLGNARYRRGVIIDISARAGIEGEFRRAARLRQVVFEAARMAAWHLDTQTGRFTCIEELLLLLDTDQSRFAGTLAAVENTIHPEDRGEWRSAMAAALREGGRLETEFRIITGAGGIRWLLARGETMRGADRAPLESYGVMIDITERKAAEEAAARLAVIISSSVDAIISKSLEGIVLSWNGGAERLFGYKAAEMIGQPMRRVIPEESQNEETLILDTIRRGETIAPYESVRLHKSGRRIPVAVSVSPIRNAKGVITGASTIAHDITERRRQGERLRENEARMRLALKSARAGAWDFDLTRRELHWSSEMFALYGLDPAAGLPTRGSLALQVAQSHRKRARLAFARAMLQGGSFTLEFPIIRPDGKEIWTALSGEVTQDHRGRPVSARGIDQDITERKSWEQRQRLLLRELAHRVKNTLAVVQSVSRQTLRTSSDPRSFVEAFEGRIRSLAASHGLLTEADWRGAGLSEIIRTQIDAMAGGFGGRVRLRGPDVMLSAESATQIGLVLHELATNAVKYGALSVPAGIVNVVWKATPKRLRLMWREDRGPPVAGEPVRRGFGSILIESSVLEAERRFQQNGLVCKLLFAR